jgi:hypothetical protein
MKAATREAKSALYADVVRLYQTHGTIRMTQSALIQIDKRLSIGRIQQILHKHAPSIVYPRGAGGALRNRHRLQAF